MSIFLKSVGISKLVRNEQVTLPIGTTILLHIQKKMTMWKKKKMLLLHARTSRGMLKLSSNDCIVEPSFNLPLSHDNCPADPCNNEELCDSAFIICIPHLVNENDSFALQPKTFAKNKFSVPIATRKDEKLLSSLKL